jgi:hypothetical protein
MYLMTEEKGSTCGLPSLFCDADYIFEKQSKIINGVMSEWSKEIE